MGVHCRRCGGGQPVAAQCPEELAAWRVLPFLGCHDAGLAPAACPVASAQLRGGEGTLRCPCGSPGVLGARCCRCGDVGRVHGSAEEGAGVGGVLAAGLRPGPAGAARCGCTAAGLTAGHGDGVVTVPWCRPVGARWPTHACARTTPRPASAGRVGQREPTPARLSFGRSRGRTWAPALLQGCSLPAPAVGLGHGGWGAR